MQLFRPVVVLAASLTFLQACSRTDVFASGTLAIEPASVTVELGGNRQFTVSPAASTVRWSVSPEEAGAVDPGGLFTASARLGAAGLATVRATLVGDETVFAEATVTLIRPEVGEATTVLKAGGDNQNAIVGEPLPAPLRVRVFDEQMRGVPGVVVRFPDGTETTDALGYAEASPVAGEVVGPQRFEVSVDGVGTLAFVANLTAGSVAALEVTHPEPTGIVSTTLAAAAQVLFTDRFGNVVPGQSATATTSGTGAIEPLQAASDAFGVQRFSVTLGAELGVQSFAFRSDDLESVLEIEAVGGAPALLQLISGDAQAGNVGLPLTRPLVVRLLDATGLPASGGTLTWTAPDGGQLTQAETTVDEEGYASAAFVLPTRAGVVRVVVDAGGVSGSPATFTLRANAGVAQRLQPVSGGNQTTTAGEPFGGAYTVRVTDGYSNGVAGVAVAFESVSGGGSVSEAVVVSGADGLAQTQLIAGGVGAQRYRASVTGLVGSPLEVTNQAVAVNPALTLELVSGQDQQAIAGSDLPQPFIVRLLRDGLPAAQHAVTFAVASGGGSVRPSVVTTASNGTAAATARLGPGEGGQRFAASVPGAVNSPLFFEATSRPRPVAELRIVSGQGQTGLPGEPLALPFVVQAVDTDGQPLSGRTVTFATSDEGNELSDWTPVTDAQGLASTLAKLTSTEGTHSFTATCEGINVTFDVVVSSRQALRLVAVSGDNLTAEVGLVLPEPFVLRAVNAAGAPVAGVEVTWRGESPLSSVSHAFTVTDAQGEARVTGTLGRLVGLQRFFAEAEEAQPLQFRATAIAAPAERLSIVSGDGQRALAATALSLPLVVAALDRVGNPVMNVPVSFRADVGGGQVSTATVSTVANGEASTSATLGALIGPQTFVAESPGLSRATFTARATSAISHLSVSPQGRQMEVGSSLRFQATAVYTDGTSGDVTGEATWSVLDASALSIDDAPGSKGLARALAAGSTSVRATLAGASGATPVTVVPASLRALSLLPAVPRMVVGATRAFTATGTFSNDAVASVTETSSWTSSDPAVATVSDFAGTRGLVTATGVGSAVITATSQGVTASRTVVVSAAALEHLEISPIHVSLPAGAGQAFTATATYSDGTVEDVTSSARWSSSDESRLTVQNAPALAGYATLLSAGTASVRVTWGGRTVEQPVRVTDATVVGLTVQPGRIDLAVRDFFQFQVVATYSDGTVKDARQLVTWTTSNAAVADVSNASGSEGVVTGLSPGQAVITAKLGARIASGTAVVNGDAYQQLRIFSDGGTTCPIGGALFLQAGAIYDSFPPRSVDISDQASWSSSDAEVAVVGNGPVYGGSVRCLKPGRITVTAAWRGVSDTREITVTSATLSSLTIVPAQVTLSRGDVQPFFANARYTDGSELDVTSLASWASQSPNVVTVSNAPGTRGVATGQGAGTARVLATLDGVIGTATVTGTGAALTEVVLTPVSPSPRLRERFQQFTATALYDDGSRRDVTAQAKWDISNTAVADVSTDSRFPGLVVLQSPGSCEVVATYAGLPGHTTLTVRP